MAEFAALPLFTDSFLADTAHLTDAEAGRYLRLLMLIWRSPGCRIPNDPDWLARKFQRTRAESDDEIGPLIREFCQSDGNWISQKRLSKEFEYLRKTSMRQSVRSKARWDKEKGKSRGNAAPAMPLTLPYPILESSDSSESSDSRRSVQKSDGGEAGEMQAAVAAYNALARQRGLPLATKITSARRIALRARLREAGGLPGWTAALGHLGASDFLCGAGAGGWRANLDFVLQASSFQKLREGAYDRTNGSAELPEPRAPDAPAPRLQADGTLRFGDG